MDFNTPYRASLTRVPFMFYEMRIVAELLSDGLSEDAIIEKVYAENLFQYPTEKTLKNRTKECLRRLSHLDMEMISWINKRTLEIASQVCLYAFMKDSRLIYEFMLTVIGEKYETKDFAYGKELINVFFMRLQEQNEQVAGWSDATIKKLISVINGMLRDTGYIDKITSKKLNDVMIDYKLKDKIIENGDAEMLPAFNCFEGN